MIPANNSTLVFDLLNQSEALAYTNLLAGLISNGLSYGTENKGARVIIIIGDGY